MAPAQPPREVAVIDIGSNSVRMVLYRLEGRAVWTVLNEKVLAGLGRDLASTGRLSPEGCAMTLTALRRFAAVLDGVKPQALFVAATAAVRDAADGPEFRDRIAAETGLQPRILSGEDEARYAALGVLAGAPAARGVVADMGGASLELIRIDDGGVGRGVTLPLGPFSLTGKKGFDAPRVRGAADKALSRVADAYRTPTLHAVGGAWRSLAQVRMAFGDHPLRIVHQFAMSADEARDLARLIGRASPGSLDKVPGLSKKRAETLPHAAVVLDRLIEHLGLKRIEFSAWGVREGLLFESLDVETAGADPLLAGSAALGLRQGVSPALPAALDAWIAPILSALPAAFGPDRDAVLAHAACNLADLGARLHPDHRVELVFDQVLRAPVPGQTHSERAFLATALNARYGGGSATPEPQTMARLLSPAAATRARALGLAMRLGCDLSGRSPELLSNASLQVDGGALRLAAAPDYSDLLLGEQTRRRARALAETMDLTLVL
ncbi:MAG: Ppx/GppA family phosphatase [Brevundimonas sp.]|uniref:Ppx/GppA phosphatase family protein n=1 Tax=Brevundimonas sp. TaxID=1871086 RepID=UPI0025C5AA43|nr:Ppx/GppA phosphatase family protein [Brevundimonas sp.]MBX3476462.1 Ppx/GppA family phosphatase [Brevundimonas sp.]